MFGLLSCIQGRTQIDVIEDYIAQRLGTTLALPWPKDWKLTFYNIRSIPGMYDDDLEDMRKTFLCCETKLTVIGILHKKKNSMRGPILLSGETEDLYVYNTFGDRCLYYVSKNFQEFFSIGLKYFYPIYETLNYLTDTKIAEDLKKNCRSFAETLFLRDRYLTLGFVLRTAPYQTLVRFCDIRMTNFGENDLIKWRQRLKSNFIDVLFCAQYNFYGKWIELVIIYNARGMLFAVDVNEKIIYVAKNVEEFLKMGCLRYVENRRLHTEWFLSESSYVKREEEEFAQDIVCPRGPQCKRKRFRKLRAMYAAMRGLRCCMQRR